jgi:hypothetical protein
MENVSPNPLPRRWPLFVAGVLLFLLGPVVYIIQTSVGNLATPWYAPILASIGVLLMGGSVWQRRGVWGSIALAPFVLVGGLEWFMLVVGMRTPPYTGPAALGQRVPAFATTLADGQAFTDRDLTKGQSTILLFFRGRW